MCDGHKIMTIWQQNAQQISQKISFCKQKYLCSVRLWIQMRPMSERDEGRNEKKERKEDVGSAINEREIERRERESFAQRKHFKQI